jgi:hypothetical protein
MDIPARKRRIASNESRFREINERLEAGLRQVRHAPELLDFVCECGNRDCELSVQVRFDEYEAVRRDSRRFLVVPGHVFPETERVVAGSDRYEVVEKFGEVTKLTDATDQRVPGTSGTRSDDDVPGS